MGDVVGPFEMAQKGFHRKQIIPLCAGWFGEVNIEFVEVIKSLARMAAAGEVGLAISSAAVQARYWGCDRLWAGDAQDWTATLHPEGGGGGTPQQQQMEAREKWEGTVVF